MLCTPPLRGDSPIVVATCYSFWSLDVQLRSPWWVNLNLNFKFLTDSKSFIKNIRQCSLFPYFGFMILSYQRSCGSNGKIKDMLTLIKKSLLLVANHLIIYFIYLFFVLLYRNNYIIIKINLVVVIVNCKKRPLKG